MSQSIFLEYAIRDNGQIDDFFLTFDRPLEAIEILILLQFGAENELINVVDMEDDSRQYFDVPLTREINFEELQDLSMELFDFLRNEGINVVTLGSAEIEEFEIDGEHPDLDYDDPDDEIQTLWEHTIH